MDAMKKTYDRRYQAVFEALRQTLETPIPAKKPIGFHPRAGFRPNSAKFLTAALNNTK